MTRWICVLFSDTLSRPVFTSDDHSTGIVICFAPPLSDDDPRPRRSRAIYAREKRRNKRGVANYVVALVAALLYGVAAQRRLT